MKFLCALAIASMVLFNPAPKAQAHHVNKCLEKRCYWVWFLIFPIYRKCSWQRIPGCQVKKPRPRKPAPKKPAPMRPSPKKPEPKKPAPKKPEPKKPDPKEKPKPDPKEKPKEDPKPDPKDKPGDKKPGDQKPGDQKPGDQKPAPKKPAPKKPEPKKDEPKKDEPGKDNPAGKVFTEEILNAYLNWKSIAPEEQKGLYKSKGHAGACIKVLVNPEAEKMYNPGEKANLPFKTGSIIATAAFAKGQKAGGILLMKKMEAGFNPQGGDWAYGEIRVDKEGKKTIVAEGKLAMCMQCHQQSKDYDYAGTVKLFRDHQEGQKPFQPCDDQAAALHFFEHTLKK